MAVGGVSGVHAEASVRFIIKRECGKPFAQLKLSEVTPNGRRQRRQKWGRVFHYLDMRETK
jgi:hypothetical protein